MKKAIKKTDKIKLLFLVGSLGTGGAERFVANAPEDVLEKNRSALSDAKIKQEKVLEQLSSLKG